MAREHKKQVTVLLEPEEDRRFSAYCEEKGYKKSTLIARLVRDHLDKEGFQSQGLLFQSASRNEYTK